MRQVARVARHLILLIVVVLATAGQASAAGASPAPAADAPAAPFAGRWIDVNLTTLRATAFQGATAVYSTGVTTGKPGYRTPTGTYYIFSRYRIQDMQSQPGDPKPYFQANVQYVQYFRAGGFALHANYWQPASVFGRANTSHGCVGMPTSAARYFWSFATYGTPVYIHFGATPGVPPPVKVSAVVGKSLADAKTVLQKAGLKVAVKYRASMLDNPDTVLAQSTASGRTVTKGTTITLTVAQARALTQTKPPDAEHAYAPDVVGLTEAQAVDHIDKAGLRATYVNYFDDKTVPASLKASLLAVRKGAVFATLTPVGERLPLSGDYMILVRR